MNDALALGPLFFHKPLAQPFANVVAILWKIGIYHGTLAYDVAVRHSWPFHRPPGSEVSILEYVVRLLALYGCFGNSPVTLWRVLRHFTKNPVLTLVLYPVVYVPWCAYRLGVDYWNWLMYWDPKNSGPRQAAWIAKNLAAHKAHLDAKKESKR